MKTGIEYADQASNKKYDSLKYSDADCQAFCEIVLRDIGVRTATGKVYNWKGSNDMARNATSWIGTKEDCIKEFGCIPLGAWAFMWDNSGKEKERGYYDGKGNYSHIGIYIGNDTVRDSTRYKDSSGKYVRDGVGNRKLSAFNRIGLCKVLDFGNVPEYNDKEKMLQLVTEMKSKLNELEELIK